MGVSVSTTAGLPHTWGTADYTWGDFGLTLKTWDTATPNSISCDADDPIALVEDDKRGTSRAIAEVFAASDKRRCGFGLFESETFGMVDEFTRIIVLGLALNEAFGLADTSAFSALQQFYEAFATASSSKRGPGVSRVETLGVDDQEKTVTLFNARLDEALGMMDAEALAVALLQVEAFGLVDDFERVAGYMLRLDELLSVSETYQDDIRYLLNVMESFAVGTQPAKAQSKSFYDGFSATDQQAAGVGVFSTDGFGVSDVAKNLIAITHRESWETADLHSLGQGKPIAETFGVSEQSARGYSAAKYELLGIADVFKQTVTYFAAMLEVIGFSDFLQRSAGLAKSDAFGIGDHLKKALDFRLAEAMAMSDMLGRVVAYNRALDENFSTSDAIKRVAALSLAESIEVGSELLRNGLGVYSEAELFDRALSDEEFRALLLGDAPSGYKSFRPFLPGDYEYQEALVRVALIAKDTDRAVVSHLEVDIDVPDVSDRGTQVVDTPGAVRIYFGRRFLTPPEVTLTTKGGVVGVIAIPKIIGAITRTYFDAIIEDVSGEAVAGTFAWSAVGY